MDSHILQFTESDNINFFALFAYLKGFSKNLTEQIILSYLTARHKHRVTSEGLYIIPDAHLSGLCDTMGCNRRSLNKTFQSLAKTGKIELKLNAHGVYARLTDAIPMPKENEKFVKLPVCRPIPVRPDKPEMPKYLPNGFCDTDEAEKFEREYEKNMKIYRIQKSEYAMKLARYRLHCLEYSLTGRPYIMYRIVKAMYNEIAGAGAFKKAQRTHKKMKPLKTGAVYGLKGFQYWIGGDAKTIRKDVEVMLSVGKKQQYGLVWQSTQSANTGHLQYFYTPVPASIYTDDELLARQCDIHTLDVCCESILRERQTIKADSRALCKLKDYKGYYSYAFKQWKKAALANSADEATAVLFGTPEKYGIPTLGMIFCLSPIHDVGPLFKIYDDDDTFLNKQRELTHLLAKELTGKQREIWERPETQAAYKSAWSEWSFVSSERVEIPYDPDTWYEDEQGCYPADSNVDAGFCEENEYYPSESDTDDTPITLDSLISGSPIATAADWQEVA